MSEAPIPRVGDWDDLRGDKAKIGRPRFPVEYRTMNVYLPNELHDRLAKRAAELKVSRSALIRSYVASCLEGVG